MGIRIMHQRTHQFRLSLTQTVDGLFDITDTEYIMAIGNACDNGILQF